MGWRVRDDEGEWWHSTQPVHIHPRSGALAAAVCAHVTHTALEGPITQGVPCEAEVVANVAQQLTKGGFAQGALGAAGFCHSAPLQRAGEAKDMEALVQEGWACAGL